MKFEDVLVPVENRLGEEGEGFTIAMKAFDITRLSWRLVQWVGTRSVRTPVRMPVSGFQWANLIHQAVNLIADMAKDIEAARLLVRQSAWTIDQGIRNTSWPRWRNVLRPYRASSGQ